jgi:poly(3-hydroxyalkanoate) synthetase
MWPALAAATAGDVATSFAKEFAKLAIGPEPTLDASDLPWTTPNRVALELASVRLRDFSISPDGTPTLICAPFALHGATIADLAGGHSVVAALLGAHAPRVFVTDWRSAAPDMRFLTIDNYLADLHVLVTELGGKINLVGLCQGGWMALLYAARFPDRVRKLVLAGAPIDIAAGDSVLSRLAQDTPISMFKELVELGEGCVRGQHILRFWASAPHDSETIHRLLQVSDPLDSAPYRKLEGRFRDWYARTLDLPGNFYLQVVQHLFKKNRLATGAFVALGKQINLRTMRAPLYLLAARDDEIVAAAQIFATEHLVGTPKRGIRKSTAPGSHLGLFMGRTNLLDTWSEIAAWLAEPQTQFGKSAPSLV